MRLLPVSTAILLLAGCAGNRPPVAPVRPVPQQPAPVEKGDLIGLPAADLIARFGPVQFQVREGPGVKLQWQGTNCVLDAYLYPPTAGAGAERVAHVDTRRPVSGDPVDQAACLASLRRN